MKARKAPRQRLERFAVGSAEKGFAEEVESLEEQKRSAREYADAIERGELPDQALERGFIAHIL